MGDAHARGRDMGPVLSSLGCCGLCVVPCYSKDDALMDDDNPGETNKKPTKWCVDDSATERVFIPDGKSTQDVGQPLF